MAEKPDQIRQHIEAQRERLDENLQTLENRVRNMADWRVWVDRKPLAALAAAFAAGLALALRIK